MRIFDNLLKPVEALPSNSAAPELDKRDASMEYERNSGTSSHTVPLAGIDLLNRCAQFILAFAVGATVLGIAIEFLIAGK